MCSVVGYVGDHNSRAHIIEGLSRLEYRGYDSAGFACINSQNHRVSCIKSQGGIDQLVHKIEQSPIDGLVGIGHTRWATHGAASDVNAHPHFDCHKTVAVVHNGIVENFRELKEELEIGEHVFASQTDTEVIAHLLETALTDNPDSGLLVMQLVRMLSRVEGAYAFVALMEKYPDTILAVRKRSPLCIGIGDGDAYVASDALAFAGKAQRVLFLPDESFALVTKGSFELYDFSGKRLNPVLQDFSLSWNAGGKDGHDHFMLKEIYEQRRVVGDTVNFLRLLSPQFATKMGLSEEVLEELSAVNFLGCGTSWHAGRIAQFFFEQVALLPARSCLASEFRYQHLFNEPHALYIAISQSGETADTLEALRLINDAHMPTVALTNVISSTIVRESTGFLITQAGQEVAVASTKAFTAQVAALFWLAHRIALHKGLISSYDMLRAEEDLLLAGTALENSIEQYKFDIITEIAPFYARYKQFIFVGRHISYAFALEAALKVKEITYIFVDCYPAGELKHGALALIEPNVPVFVFSSIDPLIYQKLLANAQEIKARSGHIVAFAFEGQRELIELADRVFIFPRVHPLLAPVVMTGVVQFLAYQMAKVLGRPIDKPRNLAKSVTVE